jgi:type IV pilus assembly protein PilP
MDPSHCQVADRLFFLQRNALKKVINRCLLAISILLLASCGTRSGYSDIDTFMDEVAAKPHGSIAPLPEFEPYKPFTYGASNRRSPFEPPVVIQVKTEQQRKNIGVKPPSDHVKQFLERFNLASLQMVGTLQQDEATWALIEDDSGGVHRVQVGDYMGTSWGKIESINDFRIDIIEIVTDGGDGWLRRPRSIEIKGNSG